ncbi:hypothetical protein SAZ_38310 [Streptomyces noursei ZPM]|nr:hypothetical protein SAZ_38310 [Streptomyces noursei ZPM]
MSSHSMVASAAVSSGAPLTPERQSTSVNLSPPVTANCRHRSSWSAARTFTANRPAALIFGQVVDVPAGQKHTSGGSRETEENDWTAMPAGWPSDWIAVITATPVQKRLSVSRIAASSNDVVGAVGGM